MKMSTLWFHEIRIAELVLIQPELAVALTGHLHRNGATTLDAFRADDNRRADRLQG